MALASAIRSRVSKRLRIASQAPYSSQRRCRRPWDRRFGRGRSATAARLGGRPWPSALNTMVGSNMALSGEFLQRSHVRLRGFFPVSVAVRFACRRLRPAGRTPSYNATASPRRAGRSPRQTALAAVIQPIGFPEVSGSRGFCIPIDGGKAAKPACSPTRAREGKRLAGGWLAAIRPFASRVPRPRSMEEPRVCAKLWNICRIVCTNGARAPGAPGRNSPIGPWHECCIGGPVHARADAIATRTGSVSASVSVA